MNFRSLVFANDKSIRNPDIYRVQYYRYISYIRYYTRKIRLYINIACNSTFGAHFASQEKLLLSIGFPEATAYSVFCSNERRAFIHNQT